MKQFKPFSPTSAVAANTINSSQKIFVPVSPKQIAESGASNQEVVKLLSTFDSPTGILEYGKDVMASISAKSDLLLAEVKDADVDYVESQLRNVLTLAKSFHLKPNTKDKGWLTSLTSKVKEHFIDTKEQLLSEFNTVSTQMDRIVKEVEDANTRILSKITSLQSQYQQNIQDYKNLEIIIKNAVEAFEIKSKELDRRRSSINDALDAQEISRMQANLDRLDKKIDNLKKFQLMCLQDAPNLALMEDNAVTLLEKFETIKSMTIPLWKKQIRMYIDGQELYKAANLANSIDDANNQMIQANSNANKTHSIETAKLNQRAIIDDSTAETVHQNLLDTFDELLNITSQGRQRRIDSSNRMDEMKRLYASIASGQTSINAAKTVAQSEQEKFFNKVIR